MALHLLERRQLIPGRTLAEVFHFFERPENLEQLTPPALRFVILTPSPIRMRAGTLIDYVLRVHYLPIHWRTMITHYDPPHEFVDEQLKGPYAMWHHTHRFRQVPEGVEIEDLVRYMLPLAPLGELAHPLVRRDLNRIFNYRHKVIGELFAGRAPLPREAAVQSQP